VEQKLRKRLDELRSEYEKGRKAIEDLDTQASNLKATLLRISGAIQVLQEELGEGGEHLAAGAPD